ncbi:MAG: carboxypeptidase regulatory-like domain-containing protein [Bryobacteraceae bacterium]
MVYRFIRSLAGLLLCVLMTAGVAVLHAQVTATILGIAKDSSGAFMPHVKVTATNTETNLVQENYTDALGEYRIMALPVGRYKVEAELAGFQKFVAEDVVLTVDEQHRVDLTMQLGSLQQEIQVEADAVQVETTATQLGNVINDKAMVALPLNGRSYIDLFSIQAGVAPQSSSTGNISVNGQRVSSNAFLVNGGDVSEGVNFGTSIIPNLDSIAEFRLVTNSFDPEYGRFSGAIMNAITKSGTNGLHGSAFDFLRNSDMDSRSFFNTSVAELKRNQFGYAVGGPALKNRLFWFTDFQGTPVIQGSSSSLAVLPSVAQRSGVFDPNDLNGSVSGPYWASLLSQRLGYTVTNNEDYSSPACVTSAECVFPNGVIPAKAMSPIAVNMLQKYVPLPNQGTTGYLLPSVITKSGDNRTGQRVDFNNKKTGNWSGYYHFDDGTSTIPGTFGAAYGNFGQGNYTRAQQGVLTNTRVLGPSTVNEFRLDYTRNAAHADVPTDQPVSLSSLGFVTGANTLGIVSSTPYDSVPNMGLVNFSFGRNAQQNQGKYENTYHIGDGLSKTVGSHAFKFGGSFLYMQVNERNVYAPSGSFSFDGSETGSDIADFLLGAPASYTQASFQLLDSRTKYGSVYAQDSWRIKPNLTINYGVRWEASMPWYDTQNKIETIVPGQQSTVFPGAPPGWVFPGDKGIPTTLAPTRWGDFSPRLGIAWSPDNTSGILRTLFGGPGKTSIRAATGMFYTAIQDAGLFEEVADAPYGLYWEQISPPLLDQPFLTRADGSSQTQRFPFILPVPGSAAVKNINWSEFYPIASSPGYKTDNVLPYAEHLNFSLQRQITGATVLTLAYVGTEGHHLFSHYEANPGNAALCLSLRGSGVLKGTTQCGRNLEDSTFTLPNGTQLVGTRSPLGSVYYSEDSYLATQADSNYNSFQATLERRARNMTFLAAYTFSKAIDDASTYGAYLDFYNFRDGRGLSTYDCTSNFVISYSYTLPFYRIGALPKRLTEGWAINGITRAATGLPVSLSQSGDYSLTGGSGVDRPNYIGGLVLTPNVRDTVSHQEFNKSAFTQEALGTQGDAALRFFHGPGTVNFDFGMQKTTKLRESMSLLIRGEFFNVMNHTNFSNPSGNYSSASFGRVTGVQAGTSGTGARVAQVAMKFLW